MKIFIPIFSLILLASCKKTKQEEVHVFEIKEIILEAKNEYQNPYTEIEWWLELKGPDFNKRIYGFWDGGNTFRIRLAATKTGEWTWTSGSNQADSGLNEKSGKFTAINWTEEELQKNPNRRGFIKPTPNGHALQYADGTPFFFIGDTWWAAATWRYLLTNVAPDTNWVPSPKGISLENILHYRKKQGYNSLAVISSYPNWDDDGLPGVIVDNEGIGIRQAWEKWSTHSAKDMHSDDWNKPFEISDYPPMANFHKIVPAYFQSMDKKMNLSRAIIESFFVKILNDISEQYHFYFGQFLK